MRLDGGVQILKNCALAAVLCLASAEARGAPQASNQEIFDKLGAVEGMLRERIDWSGELETNFNSYRGANYVGHKSQQEAVARAHLRPRLEIGQRFLFKSDFMFRGDALNADRNTARIDEGYLLGRFGAGAKTALRAGKIMYNWGVDALFNPTDFLNPVDYYDLYHSDKLGALAIDFEHQLSGEFSVMAGVLPVFQPSIYFDAKSRWINYSTFMTTAAVNALKTSLPAFLGGAVTPPADYVLDFNMLQRTPKNPQPFLRLQYKGVGFDAALAYTYRYGSVPQFVLLKTALTLDVANGFPQGQIIGEPRYQQEHYFAFDIQAPLFKSVIFFAIAGTLPAASHNDLPSNQEVIDNLNDLGIGSSLTAADIEPFRESQFILATLGWRKDFASLLAYFQFASVVYTTSEAPAEIYDQIQGFVGVNPSDVFDFYAGTFIPGVRWNFARKWYARAGGLLKLRGGGYALDLALQHEMYDGVSLTLGNNYINGKEGSVLQHFSQNSRWHFDMAVAF